MNELRTRLLATVATALGLIATGFDAHLAPQSDGWWHGVTGAPSPTLVVSALAAATLVWLLGRVVKVRPFLCMSAGLLPLVPAITGWGSPLLFFSGYTTWLVFAIVLGWTSLGLVSRLPRLKPGLVILISFSFFVLVGRYLPGAAGPQGDEPHYLLIAESLLKDADVDLQNQFTERAFSKFTAASLEPHTAPRSPQGKLYAIHTPGLSALVAPGYALNGYAGARAVISLIMAIVVGLLYFVAWSRFGTPTASFVFVVATFASPLPIYANSVFPDSVATLPVAATLACLASPLPVFRGLAATAIATLPWIHPRFLPLALVLALSLTLSGGHSLRKALLAFGPLSVSIGFMLLHFQALFGSASLSAAYGPGFAADVSLTRIPWGASALILDRQFGLLLFAPVLLIGLPGVSRLWKSDRMMAATAGALALAVLGVGGSFSMWWGGASAPSRFLIAAVPALLLLCGALWPDSESTPDRRGVQGAASGFGLGLLCLACWAPRVLHNRSDGDSGLLRLLAPVLDVDRFFPGFLGNGFMPWVAGIWGGVLVVTLFRPRLGPWLAALPIAFAALVSSNPLLDPFSASLRALASWSDHRRTFGGLDFETAFALEVPLGNSSWDLRPGTDVYSSRFSLPRGAWTLLVESDPVNTPDALNVGRISLMADENSAPLASIMLRVGEKLAISHFELDQDERRLHLRGEGLQSRASVRSVRLRPQARAESK